MALCFRYRDWQV